MSRKFIFFIVVFLGFFSLNSSAQYGAHVIKVVDLPNTPEYCDSTPYGSPKYLDLGIAHEQIRLIIPLWNYGEPRYVLYREDPGGVIDYYTQDLDKEKIAYFHEMYGIPLTPEIPFWDKWGGKLVLILLIVLYFVWENRK